MNRWMRFNGKKNIKQMDESLDKVVATVPILARTVRLSAKTQLETSFIIIQ